MSTSSESEARKALNRLRRSVEKTEHELDAVANALRRAEAEDFPETEFAGARSHLAAVIGFIEEQAERIEEKILSSGGLEPGRIRRS